MSYGKIGFILVGLLAFVPTTSPAIIVRADLCSCVGAIVQERVCDIRAVIASGSEPA